MVEETDIVKFLDENGLEHRFSVVEVVEVDRRRYAVLLPEDEEDAPAVIFRMEADDVYVPLEDDDELRRVMTALEETAGYSEIILEDEDEEDGQLDEMGGEVDGEGDDPDYEDDDEEE